MFLKKIKFILIVCLLYQTPLYSKSTSLSDYNSKNFIKSIDNRLYAFGDWCEGPSIQDAWLSGKKLAKYFSEMRLN